MMSHIHVDSLQNLCMWPRLIREGNVLDLDVRRPFGIITFEWWF